MIEMKNITDMLNEAMEECEREYPKHRKIVLGLWNGFLDVFVFRIVDHNKYLEYLRAFSDYIEKKYFPEDINPDWRHPTKIEELVMDFVIENTMELFKNPEIRVDFFNDLQKQPFYKNDPIAQFFGDLLLGGGSCFY